MNILPATVEHYPAITQLITSKDELFLVYPGGRYPFTTDQLEFLAENRSDLTVLLIDDQVVAFANIYDLVEGEQAFIGNVVVSQDHRGQGLGRKLVEYMLELIIDRYQADAHISVFAFNKAALLLYSSLGFLPYAHEERVNPQGETVALVHMKLLRTKQQGE